MRLLITRLTPVQPSHMLRIQAFCSFVNIHTSLKNSVACHFQLSIPCKSCLSSIYLVSIFQSSLTICCCYQLHTEIEQTNANHSNCTSRLLGIRLIFIFSITTLLHTLLFPFTEDQTTHTSGILNYIFIAFL